jgi:TRAP-type C4-dicarboxylate transport system permease small subunit
MARIVRIMGKLLDVIEIYIPTVCIGVTFVSFLVQIFSRYVLGSQVEWSYELTLIGFLWCLILAACNASRTNTHVAFTLFHDKLGQMGKLIVSIASNLFILVTFGILIGPAWEFVSFMSIKKTSVLKIPMNIVFFPFMVFTVLTWVHTASDAVKNVIEFGTIVKNMSFGKGDKKRGPV